MEFISLYGNQILYTIITAVLTAFGTWFGKKYKEACDEKIKRDTVKTCVCAVEQLYPDMLGEEKYIKARIKAKMFYYHSTEGFHTPCVDIIIPNGLSKSDKI